jgi:membrane-associated phospholipid phosphatase
MSHRAVLAFVIASFTFAAPAQASESGWATASDIGRNGLVIVALGLPIVQDDCRFFRGKCQGAKDAALTLGATALVTTALKESIPEERPDRSDNKSFPSGHTSISFAAAATLHKRNGWEVGIPAHIVAAFVGVARVKADKHFAHDVLAGAVIGEAAGWIITHRKDETVQWLPWGDAHGGGVTVAVRF